MRVTVALLLLALLVCIFSVSVFASDADNNDDIIVSEDDNELHIDDSVHENYLAPQPEGNVVFFDNFNEDPLQGRWVISNNPKYNGEWKWSGPVSVKGFPGDKGLLLAQPARHYAISSAMKLDNDNKDLVVQYEVKFDKKMECGGAYIKLLADENLNLETIDDKTPYIIMFGPDKCGSNERVHFIFRHYNPKSGEWQEKHLRNPPPPANDQLTHLYTLIVRKDNSFEVLIDNASVRSGTLLEDFDPAVIPPKEIDDPEDKKPADWVDEEKIPEPGVTKPEDWDEDAPVEIEDPEDSKPEDWLDNEPAEVADPNAQKPADWDDEEDGNWEAPMIANPKCEVQGCGEWKPRKIANPNYKGKWSPPMVDNPAFIGHWKPRKIANPHYFEDLHPHNFPRMGAVALELWTMQENILFDNFLISHEPSSAKAYAQQTWQLKNEKDKELAPAKETDFGGLFNEYKQKALALVQQYPIPIFSTIAAILLAIPVLCIKSCCSSKKSNSDDDSNAATADDSNKDNNNNTTEESTADETPKESVAAATPEASSPTTGSKPSKRKTRKET